MSLPSRRTSIATARPGTCGRRTASAVTTSRRPKMEPPPAAAPCPGTGAPVPVHDGPRAVRQGPAPEHPVPFGRWDQGPEGGHPNRNLPAPRCGVGVGEPRLHVAHRRPDRPVAGHVRGVAGTGVAAGTEAYRMRTPPATAWCTGVTRGLRRTRPARPSRPFLDQSGTPVGTTCPGLEPAVPTHYRHRRRLRPKRHRPDGHVLSDPPQTFGPACPGPVGTAALPPLGRDTTDTVFQFRSTFTRPTALRSQGVPCELGIRIAVRACRLVRSWRHCCNLVDTDIHPPWTDWFPVPLRSTPTTRHGMPFAA